MRNNIYFLSLLLTFTLSGCLGESDQNKLESQPLVSTPSLEEAPGTVVSKLPDQAPYTISVEATDMQLGYGVQSFAAGHYGGKWLFVGGRTNGFHLTSSSSKTFPTAKSNQQFMVFDLSTGESKSLDIPKKYAVRLRATNMEYFQDGDNLYAIGGYGSNCKGDKSNCYQTNPYLTAIDVPKAIAAVLAQNSTDLEAAIISLEDPRMSVTGGILRKVGDYFYLVFGQDYKLAYKSARNGVYTEEIARFKIQNDGTQLTISNYTAFTDPSGAQGVNSQYHRRDLNTTEAVMAGGNIGLNVLGGVFTADDGGWDHPIYILPDGDNDPAITVDTTFSLKANYYESGHIQLYDGASKVMFTTLLGGITNYSYNEAGELVPMTETNWLPFSRLINTLAQADDGIREFVQSKEQSLPSIMGSNAEFFPAEGIEMIPGSHQIIDYTKLEGNPVVLGHLAGGILSSATQVNSTTNPTWADSIVYRVTLTKN